MFKFGELLVDGKIDINLEGFTVVYGKWVFVVVERLYVGGFLCKVNIFLFVLCCYEMILNLVICWDRILCLYVEMDLIK